MTTILTDVLWSAFEADPFGTLEDGVPIALVLADLLEETGEDALAAAVRWMLREGKRPFRQLNPNVRSWWTADREFIRKGGKTTDPESDLPDDLYDSLHGGTRAEYSKSEAWHYPTFRDAVADLAQALARSTPAA